MTTLEEKDLGIGDVAQLTGLSVHALRYYEREGLLLSRHVARGPGGQRRYTPVDVKWLGLCIKLRASGMPLADIRRYAQLVRDGVGNEQQRLDLLRKQQKRVEGQLADLQECLRIIKRKVKIYERHLTEGNAGDPHWSVSA